jgi:hypothetical protein
MAFITRPRASITVPIPVTTAEAASNTYAGPATTNPATSNGPTTKTLW